MLFYALDICPNKTSGLCNQLYSIAAGIQYCINNNINLIIIKNFLMSINTDNYCNLSEVINLSKFNEYCSKKYNIIILDYNNLNFLIENAELTDGENCENLKDIINSLYNKKNHLFIPKNTKFYLKNISKNDKQLFLDIKYILNDYYFVINRYTISNNLLDININVKFNDMNFSGNFEYIQNEIFFDILRNISFNQTIVEKSKSMIDLSLSNCKNNTNIFNLIHLRIEDDVLEHYEEKLNINKYELKKIVENKYINLINKFLDKNDVIIILTYNTNNNVIKYLNENNYNILINIEKDTNREISAIYDLLLAELCNNYYICVWESTFSFTVHLRINKNPNVKGIQIYYEYLNVEYDFVKLLY